MPFAIRPTELPGVLLCEPTVYADARGFFAEVFHGSRYAQAGILPAFVQDNHSRSCRDTLRGLHYQLAHPQGKLVYVVRGSIFDVAVDIRRGSPTFGRHVTAILSDENHHQLYIPPGFAHGFCALSDQVDLLYKCTDVYHPGDDFGLAWNDPQLGIAWPVPEPLLSDKDRRAPLLAAVVPAQLPRFSPAAPAIPAG
jgi:dTDP-4-dehydrorhamnose 3,5-epimerase